MPPRARFDGDTAVIVEALCGIAQKPNFLKYAEDLAAPVNRNKVEEAGSMWKVVFKVWPALAVSQTFVEGLMKEVEQRKCAEWGEKMPEDQMKSWATAVAKQFRSQGRGLSRALHRRKAWAEAIVRNDEEAEEEEAKRTDQRPAKETKRRKPRRPRKVMQMLRRATATMKEGMNQPRSR